MIITRYINRQILTNTLAITLVLFVVVVLNRLLYFLVKVSRGDLDPSILMLILSYRLPESMQMILPLALMLGILLALGRLYAESEMVALRAAGMSPRRLLAITSLTAMLVMALVGWCSLQLTPSGLRHASELLVAQQKLSEFDLMTPGIFQNIRGSGRTTYTEKIIEGELHEVFMHDPSTNRVIKAQSAQTVQNEQGERFIKLQHGTIAEGLNTGRDFVLTEFDELGMRLPARDLSLTPDVEEKTLTTSALLAKEATLYGVELQWRISLIVLIPILTLLAVPLSKVSPRQGHYSRLVPAIFLYMLYLGLLVLSRGWIVAGLLPLSVGLLWVHGLFLVLALLLFTGYLPGFRNRHG